MKRTGYIVLAACVTALSGCYYDIEQDLYPNSFCDLANVTWTTNIEPLVQSRCAIPGCHVPGETSPDLTTYAGVKGSVDAGTFRDRVVVVKDMPSGSSLTSCQIQQVELWLNAGATQN